MKKLSKIKQALALMAADPTLNQYKAAKAVGLKSPSSVCTKMKKIRDGAGN